MHYPKQNRVKTSELAREISKTVKKGDLFLLYGELGSGKTFFTNRLCKLLKVNNIVNSPSYVLLNEYIANENDKNMYKIFHYDLYRLSSTDEALELGILDRLNEGVTIIEWPELIRDYLPETRTEIYFEHNKKYRDIIVEVTL